MLVAFVVILLISKLILQATFLDAILVGTILVVGDAIACVAGYSGRTGAIFKKKDDK